MNQFGKDAPIAVGGTTRGERRKAGVDAFWTKPWAVDALLSFDLIPSGWSVWEPACGTGMMSKALKANGLRVTSTDKYDWGYGKTGIDFLKTKRSLDDVIITNPPFILAHKFIEHAVVDLQVPVVAMLCKILLMETRKRGEFFIKYPPSDVIVLPERILFDTPEKTHKDDMGGFWACAWYVWKAPHKEQTTLWWYLRERMK